MTNQPHPSLQRIHFIKQDVPFKKKKIQTMAGGEKGLLLLEVAQFDPIRFEKLILPAQIRTRFNLIFLKSQIDPTRSEPNLT
jgi:hypothetical protein